MRVAFAASAFALCAASTITLTGDAILVIPAGQSTGVSMAMRDVSRDFYRTLGITPALQSTPPAAGSLPNGSVVVLFGPVASMAGYDVSGCATGWESHCVKAFAAQQSPNGYDTILATGNDDRGVIYAAYSFSELVLGVHPLWRWIDQQATFTPSITVNASMAAVFPSPVYTHRSIFPNDEDLLAGHRPDPLGRGVFSADIFDQMLEATLRMKGNGVLVGTNPYPDDDNVKLVARRGMVVHHHHYNLLGSNVFQWPLPGQDWDWRKDTGTMSYVWKSSIAAQASLPEVVWSIGLRGLNDESYPHCSGDADCGAQISEALANQTAWVNEAVGPNATRVLYLWDELLPLITSGDLIVPPDTDIIFTDAGAGFIEVNGNVSMYASGFYYHTAMYNNAANQLTEMVPVDRMVGEILNFTAAAKATKHAVINFSDLKPVPMTSLAFLRIVWNPAAFAYGSPQQVAADFYAQFGIDANGLSAADSTTYANIWADYFAIPFTQGGQSDNWLAEQVASLGPALATAINTASSVSASAVSAAQSALTNMGGNATFLAAASLLQQAQSLLTSAPAQRQPFFTGHTILNMGTVAYAAQATYLLAQSIVQYAAQGAAALPAVTQQAQSALAAMDSLLAIRRQAEYGQWEGLYFTDHLTDMQRARKAARQLVVALASAPRSPLPPLTPYLWYDFEVWQAPYAANYPLMNFDPNHNLPTFVRINCVFANQTAGICTNNPTGGTFKMGSDAAITLQILTTQTLPDDSLVIHYTTDGSVPTSTSPAYALGGIPLSRLGSTVHIKAMAWVNSQPMGQVSDVVYVAA